MSFDYGRGVVVRCVDCPAIIQIPSSAFDSSIGKLILERSFDAQGVTFGPRNPITGFVPVRCRVCSSEPISVEVVGFSPSSPPQEPK